MVIYTQLAKRSTAPRAITSTKRRNCVVGLRRVADELIAAGYTTLDAQAKALGVRRSTAWTIVKVKHKLGRLSEKTRSRILANPELPERVRAVFREYLTEFAVTLPEVQKFEGTIPNIRQNRISECFDNKKGNHDDT